MSKDGRDWIITAASVIGLEVLFAALWITVAPSEAAVTKPTKYTSITVICTGPGTIDSNGNFTMTGGTCTAYQAVTTP